jgi:hypothetical protein
MMPYALLIQALTSTESGRQAVVLCIRVQSDEQDYQVLLEEQSHSSEAGYASDDRRIPICAQLARTILLTDKARIWAMPSLEIIADDVVCAHGATVSDLSQEELFYLRSRGLDTTMSRNLLMYAFVDEIGREVHPSLLGTEAFGLKKRMIDRLQNLVPKGQRAIMGEFQSV